MRCRMRVVPEKCSKSLTCVEICPVKAITQKGDVIVIDEKICLGCGCCAASCPNAAIEYE
ncbi:MAG: 4Fe-4S binding protein [Holosporaceae bacterium]|nr:4Fe-4S binding protein [Holosporaceae bacterium]